MQVAEILQWKKKRVYVCLPVSVQKLKCGAIVLDVSENHMKIVRIFDSNDDEEKQMCAKPIYSLWVSECVCVLNGRKRKNADRDRVRIERQSEIKSQLNQLHFFACH